MCVHILSVLTFLSLSHKHPLTHTHTTNTHQPCCTLFNNDGYWYRGEVVGLPSTDIAEVLYVDYGNTGRVSPTVCVCVYCVCVL